MLEQTAGDRSRPVMTMAEEVPDPEDFYEVGSVQKKSAGPSSALAPWNGLVFEMMAHLRVSIESTYGLAPFSLRSYSSKPPVRNIRHYPFSAA